MTKFLLLLLTLTIASSCANKQEYNDPIPNHDTFKITSKHVAETRIINVWTPPNYTKSTDSLPVLYMPDGGVKEDFPHIANTLATLIKDKSIPPYILVGIENTERRRDLTGFTSVANDKEIAAVVGGSANFRAFITEELMPEINKKYRTNDHKGIIGESLAGLFVMETFFTKPETFDFYIAFDPSLWWNDHSLQKEAAKYLKSFTTKKTKLWFAGSGEQDISQYTNKVAQTLGTTAPTNVTWNYSNEPKQEHSTIFRATKEKAIRWTLQDLK
ncbi:alpha/beta hydrolase [Flavobacterium sp.]